MTQGSAPEATTGLVKVVLVAVVVAAEVDRGGSATVPAQV
jgi:hypothetical protein